MSKIASGCISGHQKSCLPGPQTPTIDLTLCAWWWLLSYIIPWELFIYIFQNKHSRRRLLWHIAFLSVAAAKCREAEARDEHRVYSFW